MRVTFLGFSRLILHENMKLRNGKTYKFRTYKSLMWKCDLLYGYYPDIHHCTPIRPHGICIGNWVKANFKYRINRVLCNKISHKERFTTRITLPPHATKFVSKFQWKGPWCLDDVLAQSFTIYPS